MVFSRRWRGVMPTIAVVLQVLCQVTHSEAAEQHALLIANLNYRADVGRLKNPKRDIDLIASALVQIGFAEDRIIRLSDLDAKQLLAAVRAHVARVKSAGPGALSFFYYSGHGAAAPLTSSARFRGSNYVIPVDVESTRRPDFWERAVALEEIGRLLEEAGDAVHIVVFDACRTELVVPDRDVIRGFVPISLSDQVGMLYAFASAPNTPASDGLEGDDHGPYAQALAREIVRSEIDHLHLFASVRTDVANRTGRRQIPWIRDGLLNLTYLSSKRPKTASALQAQGQCPLPIEVKLEPIFWDDLPDRRRIVFKRGTVTFAEPRSDARLIEQTEKDDVHRVAENGRISVGKVNGKPFWYRYVRDVGSPQFRYVPVADVDLR